MTNVPDELRYTKEHEWARLGADGRVTVGITDFAQEQLGDVVYLDLPEQGAALTAGQPLGEVESTKSVSDIYSPLSGKVVEINSECTDNPAVVNQDPYGLGWLLVIEPADSGDLEQLMDADTYLKFLEEEAGGA
ncbi:MAG: glycine cleavage system protein GcvH [Actinobacteria bacterium]|nr:glycine cleavage system protein GcvH [Actinomycetota bacterium]